MLSLFSLQKDSSVFCYDDIIQRVRYIGIKYLGRKRAQSVDTDQRVDKRESSTYFSTYEHKNGNSSPCSRKHSNGVIGIHSLISRLREDVRHDLCI